MARTREDELYALKAESHFMKSPRLVCGTIVIAYRCAKYRAL